MENKVIGNKETGKDIPAVFIPIEDEGMRKFFEDCEVRVRTMRLGNAAPRLYAIYDVETEEEALILQRVFDASAKKADRDKERQAENETSYEDLLESGYDSAMDYSNPEDIVMDMVVLDALVEKVQRLEDEKRMYADMILEEKTEREVAEENGMTQTKVHNTKTKVLNELKESMKDYKD